MKTKEEMIKEAFDKDIAIVLPQDFEMPVIHIENTKKPVSNPLDYCDSIIKYVSKAMVTKNKEINDEILKNINEIIQENDIDDYYGIDEKRLIEIIEEAKAFELIKDTFSMRNAVLEVCDNNSKVLPKRRDYVKNMLLKVKNRRK